MRRITSLVLFAAITVLMQQACFAASNYQYQPPIQQGGYQPQYPQYPQTQYPLPQYSMPQYPAPQQNAYNDNYGYYNTANTQYADNNSTLYGSAVMVPANTSFSAVLMTPLSSDTAKLGDSVTMYLPSDFYYGRNLIAGAGSKINGSVVKVRKSGYGEKNGQLQIKFNTIVTPSGQLIPISASIQTSDGTGVLKAGTAADASKKYIRNAAAGAAAGALSGVIMGALSGGKVGKGAVYGTAVGGGLGLLSPVLSKGGNVDLPYNSQFEVVLDQPVTVTSSTSY